MRIIAIRNDFNNGICMDDDGMDWRKLLRIISQSKIEKIKRKENREKLRITY